jgi:peptide-methionine (R)-S-oxide reductase
MKLFGKSHTAPTEGYDVIKSDEDWRRQLSPEQLTVMFEHATERPGTSALLHEKRPGTFVCAACGAAYETKKVRKRHPLASCADRVRGDQHRPPLSWSDGSARRRRPGHVFEDGPDPTSQRYCFMAPLSSGGK